MGEYFDYGALEEPLRFGTVISDALRYCVTIQNAMQGGELNSGLLKEGLRCILKEQGGRRVHLGRLADQLLGYYRDLIDGGMIRGGFNKHNNVVSNIRDFADAISSNSGHLQNLIEETEGELAEERRLTKDGRGVMRFVY